MIFEIRNVADKGARSKDVADNNSRSLFAPVDFFMLRAPFLSLEHYLKAFSKIGRAHV